MRSRVRFLSRALSDFVEIAAYLEIEAPDAKDRLLRALVDAAEGLAVLPERAPLARDPALASRGFRALREGRYLVFYKIVGRTVRIYRVLHERRSWAILV
jgi:plasmid stabilization system protein ParE